MPGKLLDRILFTCNHEFSWPRRTEDGSYYQVCLHCGVQYRYDWARMRRLDKIQAEAEATPLATPGKRPSHPHNTRMTWHPRERRLKWTAEVQYRVKGNADWLVGQTENISRSGLLFTAPDVLEAGTELELALEMPLEIIGMPGTRVLCAGTVARVTRNDGEDVSRVATRIAGYELAKTRAAG
jgi:PilZ domain